MRTIYVVILLFSLSTVVQSDGKVIIAVRENFSLSRLYVEILTEAYRRIDIPVGFSYLPGGSSLKYSDSGELGLAGEAGRLSGVLSEYKNLKPVSIPIYQSELMAFVSDKNMRINSWDDLQGFEVTTRLGFKVVINKVGAENIKIVDSTGAALLLIEKNRSDIAVLSRVDGMAAIKKLNLKNVYMLEKPLQSSPVYHLLNKANWDLIPQLEAALRSMSEAGVLNEIVQRVEQEIIASGCSENC